MLPGVFYRLDCDAVVTFRALMIVASLSRGYHNPCALDTRTVELTVTSEAVNYMRIRNDRSLSTSPNEESDELA